MADWGVWTDFDEDHFNRQRFPNSPRAKALRMFRVSDTGLSEEQILWSQVVRPAIKQAKREQRSADALDREARKLRCTMKAGIGVRHASRGANS